MTKGRREYRVTIHKGAEGVRLSLLGEWGNIHFPNVELAIAAAKPGADGIAIPLSFEHFDAPIEVNFR